MEVSFSQFAGLVLVSCLAAAALPCYSQAGNEAEIWAASAAAATTQQAKRKPTVSFNLTDSEATLRASLWAAHILKGSTPEFITPGDIEKSSGFGITGPFSERSAGLRIELMF